MGEMVAFGKYRIVEKRRVRGSWIVYDVVEVEHDRKAELRVYSNRLAEGSDAAKEFVKTLNRIAELDHPNLPTIWDLGVVMEKGYYTMPPRDSVPLAEALAERELSFMDEVELLEAATQLGAAVQNLHDAGLWHGALSTETVYWDRRRSFPYISWIPILSPSPDEFRMKFPDIPPTYVGKGDDLYRVARIMHHILTGTSPLEEADDIGPSAAVNVPGGIDGVHEVMQRALSQDPGENFESVGELTQALDKALSKQRVRAELEKSVSSMVIPEDVLQRALEKKKEQKRRRRQETGVTAAEAPYVSPLEGMQGKVAAGVGALVLMMLMYPLLGPSTTTASRPRPKSTSGAKRPPIKRPGLKKPKTTTKKVPGKKDEKKNGKKGAGVTALKDASPTNANDFMSRWSTLKGWILSLPPAKRRNLFTYGKLVRLRAEFKKDEYGACRKLDGLIKQAVSEAD
jgi:hypothetical protein